MGWSEQIGWSVTCDRCGDGWREDQPMFASRADAEGYVLSAGWSVAGDGATCADCRRAGDCSRAGHRWGEWSPAGPFLTAGGGSWQGGVRHCATCSTAQWDPPPHRVAREDVPMSAAVPDLR